MDPISPTIASSVAGSSQAERQAVRDTRRAAETENRRFHLNPEGLEAPVDEVTLAEAVRSIKGNSHEESHEDRQEHALYGPDGAPSQGPRPSLDLKG